MTSMQMPSGLWRHSLLLSYPSALYMAVWSTLVTSCCQQTFWNRLLVSAKQGGSRLLAYTYPIISTSGCGCPPVDKCMASTALTTCRHVCQNRAPVLGPCTLHCQPDCSCSSLHACRCSSVRSSLVTTMQHAVQTEVSLHAGYNIESC